VTKSTLAKYAIVMTNVKKVIESNTVIKHWNSNRNKFKTTGTIQHIIKM